MKKYIDEKSFTKIVDGSSSIKEAMIAMGYSTLGGNYRIFHYYARLYKTNYSHFTSGFQKQQIPRNYRTLKEILVVNSNYLSTKDLKNRVLKAGLLEDRCYECGSGPTWNGKPLSLQIDHINGINNDNRIQNLRILCPNCHTQTSNYAGKGKIKTSLNSAVGSAPLSDGGGREFESHFGDQVSNLVAFQDKFDIANAINKAIKLRNDGLSPIPIIKAIREEFGMGLRDAKLIYHYSLPHLEQEAQEKFWDELADALEKLAEEDSHES